MLIFLLAVGVYGWNYSHHGNDWTEGLCSKSSTQSPISFMFSDAIIVPKENLWYLNVMNYKSAIFSPGKGIECLFNTSIPLKENLGYATKEGISDPDGDTMYTIESINFHIPAEHIFNNIRYDMEIQISHKNSKDNTGLIFSVLFKETDNPNDLRKFITDILNADTSSGEIDPVDVTGGFYYIKKFFYYNGSITEPNCTPAEWIVYDKPLNIVNTQLSRLKKLLEHGLGKSYRNTQNNNNPVFYYNGNYELENAAA